MSAKHTPGPWAPVFGGGWSVEPDDAEDSGACAWQQIAADGKTVAIAVDGNPGWEIETRLLDANVRLIAAAPRLLEELQRLVNIADSGLFRDRAELSIATHPAYDDARELIKSIIGETK